MGAQGTQYKYFNAKWHVQAAFSTLSISFARTEKQRERMREKLDLSPSYKNLNPRSVGAITRTSEAIIDGS